MNNTNDIVFTLFGLGFTWEGIGIAVAAMFSILGFLKGIIDSRKQDKYLEKSMSINYVTDKRVEWINKVREVAAEYITNIYDVTADAISGINPTVEKVNQINRDSSLLILLLNFGGDIDSVIIQIINNIYGDIHDGKYNDAQTQLSYFKSHLQIYLKLEWNRVKSEVKTGVYDEEQLHKETLELYDKFLFSDKAEKVKIKDVYERLKEKYVISK